MDSFSGIMVRSVYDVPVILLLNVGFHTVFLHLAAAVLLISFSPTCILIISLWFPPSLRKPVEEALFGSTTFYVNMLVVLLLRYRRNQFNSHHLDF